MQSAEKNVSHLDLDDESLNTVDSLDLSADLIVEDVCHEFMLVQEVCNQDFHLANPEFSLLVVEKLDIVSIEKVDLCECNS